MRRPRRCRGDVPALDGGAPLPGAARRDARVARGHRGRGHRRRGRARPDGDLPARAPRVAWPRPDELRRVRRAGVVAFDRPARHDVATATVRQGRVHRRLAERRLLARRDVRLSGTGAWSRSASDRRVPRRATIGNKVQVPPAADDIGRASRRKSCTRRSTSRAGYSDVVFAAPSPRLIETDKMLRGRPDGTVADRHRARQRFRQGRGLHRVQPALPVTDGTTCAADSESVPPPSSEQYAQTAGGDRSGARARAETITAEPADDLRQDPCDRGLARREHEVLVGRAAVAARCRCRRRLLVPHASSAGANRSRAASSSWRAASVFRPG